MACAESSDETNWAFVTQDTACFGVLVLHLEFEFDWGGDALHGAVYSLLESKPI
jgi:hypothetical protein